MMIKRTDELKQKSDETGADVNTRNPQPDSRGANSSHGPIMHLQRSLGNLAVQRLFNSGAIQAKLNIGQPNDMHEQEADLAADHVMRMSDPAVQPKPLHITPVIQRRKEEGCQASPLNRITAAADINTVRRVVWDPVEPINDHKRPFPDRWDIVGTDSLNREGIKIWKPNKGDTYWCHGFTFGGTKESEGPFSTYGREVQEKILDNDGWKETRSCHAVPEDILVFYNNADDVTHTGIIREVKLKLKSERFCSDPMLRLVIDNLLTLRKGVRGPQINQAVQRIQEALLDLGYHLPVYNADGLFGNETESAVYDYQMDRSLSYDGKIGPETLTSLDTEPQFLKSGLIDESESSLESKWGYGRHNTSSWHTNCGYGRYLCHSKTPVTDPPGAKGDCER